jgi:hypothetical protein
MEDMLNTGLDLEPERAQVVRHQVQPRLRLLGHAGENKRNMVAGVFAPGTGDDHAAALNATAIARRLQRNRHFRPRIERRGASEFDAAFVNDDRLGGKLQTGLPAFHHDGLLKRISTLKFFGAHRPH